MGMTAMLTVARTAYSGTVLVISRTRCVSGATMKTSQAPCRPRRWSRVSGELGEVVGHGRARRGTRIAGSDTAVAGGVHGGRVRRGGPGGRRAGGLGDRGDRAARRR